MGHATFETRRSSGDEAIIPLILVGYTRVLFHARSTEHVGPRHVFGVRNAGRGMSKVTAKTGQDRPATDVRWWPRNVQERGTW